METMFIRSRFGGRYRIVPKFLKPAGADSGPLAFAVVFRTGGGGHSPDLDFLVRAARNPKHVAAHSIQSCLGHYDMIPPL